MSSSNALKFHKKYKKGSTRENRYLVSSFTIRAFSVNVQFPGCIMPLFINSVVFLKEIINLGGSLLEKKPYYVLLSINHSK
jgi:hypothetical protein